MESVILEGWEAGEPVRALLSSPDRAQSQAAERVTLKLCGRDRPLVLQQMVRASRRPRVAGDRESASPRTCGR